MQGYNGYLDTCTSLLGNVTVSVDTENQDQSLRPIHLDSTLIPHTP